MLVRGAEAVQDATGAVHPITRPVVAVCRCEKSQRLPWCDGTHKVARGVAAVPGRAVDILAPGDRGVRSRARPWVREDLTPET
jgi:hypothetical protein